MPKNYTTSFKRITNAVSAKESPLILLTIDRDDLIEPIRLVHDNINVTHLGDEYIALPFSITLPEEPEEGLPYADLAIDNVGRELTTWIEACDWSQPTYTTITQILRSEPNTVQWEITMFMTDVAMTSQVVTAKLGFDDLFSMPGVAVKYTPHTSVGLF